VFSTSNIISIAALRQVLEERFPEAAPQPERRWETGWAALDSQAGGLLPGGITELSSAEACGSAFLDRMLAALRRKREFAALVDCGKTFDPGSYPAAALERLLCVFCETAQQGVKVTDLLLRDGNLPLVLLDVQALPRRELGRIPMSTWHRYQRLVEKSGTALVVLTPQPLVEAVRVRISLEGRWTVKSMRRRRSELIDELRVRVFRRGRGASSSAEFNRHIA
jgi:hypothetical protein